MAKGAALMVLMRLAVRGLGIVSTIILARLLVPADFGLVALATIFSGLLEVISNFGFEYALILNQKASRQHYDTAWTLTVLRSVITAVLLLIIAQPVASFFNDSRLGPVLGLLALSAFVGGFQNIGIVDFRKDMNFRKDFQFMVTQKLAGFVLTVALAYLWRDYWALVAGIVFFRIMGTVLSYIMHSFRPRFCLLEWRDLFGFSKWILATHIVLYLSQHFSTIIIGKLLNARTVGLYNIAFEIASLPTSELVQPITRALFPGYAKVAHDKKRLVDLFLSSLAFVVLLAMPAGAGIGVLADPVVFVFLGERWRETIPLLQILAFYGIIRVSFANTGAIFMALGRPEIQLYVVGVNALIRLPLLIFGVYAGGALGASWALVVSGIIGFVITLSVLIRLLEIRSIAFVSAIWRPAIATAVMVSGLVLLLRYWGPIETVGLTIVLLLGAVAIGGVIYGSTVFLLWRLVESPPGAERIILDEIMKIFRASGWFRWLRAK